MAKNRHFAGLWMILALASVLVLAGCPHKEPGSYKDEKDKGNAPAAEKHADGDKAGGETITIGLGLDKGASYTYKMTGNIDITQSFGGNEQNLPTMTMHMTETLDVADDDAENYTVTVTLGEFTMEIPNLSDEIKEKMDKMYAALNGAQFTFEVTPEGKVQGFNGLDEFMARMAEGMQDDPVAQNIFKSMQQYMNDEQLQNQFSMLYNFGVGDKALAVGDTWEAEYPMPLVGSEALDMNIAYTLDDVKDVDGAQTAFISFDTNLDFGEEGKAFMQDMMDELVPGMDMEFYLHKLGIKGTITFDLDNNKLVKVVPATSMSMRIMVTPPDSERQELRQTVTTTITMELVD